MMSLLASQRGSARWGGLLLASIPVILLLSYLGDDYSEYMEAVRGLQSVQTTLLEHYNAGKYPLHIGMPVDKLGLDLFSIDLDGRCFRRHDYRYTARDDTSFTVTVLIALHPDDPHKEHRKRKEYIIDQKGRISTFLVSGV